MNLKQIIDKVLEEERSAKGLIDFSVELGENEGKIPHFHLFSKRGEKAAIRIDMSFYFIHGDKTYILNSKEKKNLIKWLMAPPVYKKGNVDENGKVPKNNWENLKVMWNNYYPQDRISCSMPNYNLLEKDYKQK